MLFVAFPATVPVPFYMLVVGGVVPTLCIIVLAVQGLVVALPKFTGEGFFLLGILWAHIAILGGLLYLAASGISRGLFRVFSKRYAPVAVAFLILALLVASTFDIYRIPGHNSAPPANIVRIFQGFLS
ncbi:MAG TPA: hypothetical protein DEH27_02720 [Deltaproteobacteria bacterium]|nr:hypothetical protein [Deltaproteobacteria bacterium]